MNNIETVQAWQAMLEGRYQEAVSSYNYILSHHESLGERMNCGAARLLIGDYKGALSDFQTARFSQQQSPVKVANPKVGVALWLDGKRELACQDWSDEIKRRQAGNITHSDGAGGVEIPALLLWASAHPGLSGWTEEAVKELKSRWRTKQCQRSIWPGSIAAFLLGHIIQEDFVKAASSEYVATTARHLCQCYFYLGATHLARTETNIYRSYLELSLAFPVADIMLQPEYHLAHAELDN